MTHILHTLDTTNYILTDVETVFYVLILLETIIHSPKFTNKIKCIFLGFCKL